MQKVLIVEDEKALSRVLKEKLENEGYEAHVAKDGAAAIKMAKGKPDIILLDLILPKKDGFEVLEYLKSDDELEDIPVIVLSNLDQDEDIKRAMEGGAVDYFCKTQHPINEVVEKVAKYIAKYAGGGKKRLSSKKKPAEKELKK